MWGPISPRCRSKTNVSESDIGGVKKNAAATFTVDAYPKRVFNGKVVKVRQSPQIAQNVVTYDESSASTIAISL